MANEVIGTLEALIVADITGLSSGLQAASQQLGAFAGAAAGVVAGGLAAFVSYEDEAAQSMAALQARLGATAGEIGNFRDATKEAFGSGLFDNFTQASEVIGQVYKQLGVPPTDPHFDQLAVEIEAVSKAWSGADPAGIVQSVHDLTSAFEDLKGKPELALDFLTKISQNTGKPIQQIETDVKKLIPAFEGAGLSSLAMGGMIEVASSMGLEKLTPLSDGIASFRKNVENPSPAFKQALSDMGLNSVLADVQANKVPISALLLDVLDNFDGIQGEAKKAKDETALFGSAFSKAFAPDAVATLGKMPDDLNKIQGAASEVAKVMGDDGSLGQALKKVAAGFGNMLDDAFQRLKAGWPQIEGFFKDIWKTVQPILQPIIDFFTTVIPGAILGLYEFVQGAVGKIGAAFKAIGDAIAGALQGAIAAIKAVVDGAKALLGLSPNADRSAYLGTGGGIGNATPGSGNTNAQRFPGDFGVGDSRNYGSLNSFQSIAPSASGRSGAQSVNINGEIHVHGVTDAQSLLDQLQKAAGARNQVVGSYQ